MGAEERQILFIDSTGTVIHNLPLDFYSAGDIREAREALAKKLNLNPDDIRTRVTGLRHGKAGKDSSICVRLIDRKTLRDFFGST